MTTRSAMRLCLICALICTARGALAQAGTCVEDTPPRPNQSISASCANPAACPQDVPGLSYHREVVSYAKIDDLGPCGGKGAFCPSRCADSRASCVIPEAGAKGHCQVDLQAVLYTPRTGGGGTDTTGGGALLPAVVLVPGSTACKPGLFEPPDLSCTTTCEAGRFGGDYPPEQFCGIKSYLLQHGYAVLAMYPRGYSDSTARSTGVYVSVRADQQVANHAQCARNHPFQSNPACTAVDLHEEGEEDVGAAILYLRLHPGINPSRIGVIGHSFGGIRTLAANTLPFGQAAVVEIAAGSESWCVGGRNGNLINNTKLQSNLLDDVDNQVSSILFMQPHNDVSLESTIQLSHRSGEDRYQYESVIFQPARDSNGKPIQYGDVAHSCFVQDQDNVDRWAPVAVDFLSRYGVK